MGIGILSRDVIANVINFHNNEVNYPRKASVIIINLNINRSFRATCVLLT